MNKEKYADAANISEVFIQKIESYQGILPEAYSILAICYSRLNEKDRAKEAIKKAYAIIRKANRVQHKGQIKIRTIPQMFLCFALYEIEEISYDAKLANGLEFFKKRDLPSKRFTN